MNTDQDARRKRNKKVISIIVVLVILSVGVYWNMPKKTDISESEYFTREQVEAAIKDTIELLDAEDYAALKENSSSDMQEAFKKATLQPAKDEIAESWGALQSYGTMKITEISNKDARYVLGEVEAVYEQVSVTYNITYDQDLRIIGLSIK